MNILYTNFHNKEGGGHTTYIMALVADGRHDKFVACPSSSLLYKKLQDRGFKNLISLSFPSKLRELKDVLKAVRRFKEILAEYNIDIVHTNGSQDNRIAFYAALLGKRCKVIFTKHNTYKIKGFFSRLRFNWFNDAVIFVGQTVYESIGFSHFRTPVHVVENGIDLNYWRRQRPSSTGARIRLVSTAGISLHKGWTYLVEAIAGLPQEERERFTITMPAALELPDTLAWAQERCDIHFPGFSLDPRGYLEEGDVGFVLSQAGETISFACREMMAMGLPVIVSDFAGLPANVEESCGWVTPVGDVEAIRDVLRKILTMRPEELQCMQVAARQKAERDFDVTRMQEKTEEVYQEVMHRKA